jgi:cyclic lactone autoinducer peptide
MHKAANSVFFKAGTALSKAALSLALATSNATCWFSSYQPAPPKQLEKFKK